MDPCATTFSVTALANAIACRLSVDEVNLPGAVLTQLGDTLATIAAQKIICGSKSNGD